MNQIADFPLHLFKERNLQPSTIEGYRTAIADMVGNDKLNISKDENLTRLLDSRDKPKGRRGVPSWNLSLVLHQLTKAPFEPLQKASLKHLTFKTVFLLALGSGKRRSEIHTWLYKKYQAPRKLESGFTLSFTQFSFQKSVSQGRPGLCGSGGHPDFGPYSGQVPIRRQVTLPSKPLWYYLDRTKDLRKEKDLVFVSFRKGFQTDIVPTTISSWMLGPLQLLRLFREGFH